MSKQLMIIIAALFAVSLLAVGGYFMYGRNSTSSQQAMVGDQKSTTSSETPTQESITKGSFKDLMTQGKNVTCQINYPEQNGSGTVFVSGNKFRGDFDIMVEGKSMASHMVSDGQFAYMWTDGMNQGTKFSLETMQNFSPPPGAQATDLNKEVDMKCSNWSPDNSKFVAPTDIQFSDMTQMMQNAVNTSPSSSGMPKIDKSICEKLTNPEAKEACLNAAGAN